MPAFRHSSISLLGKTNTVMNESNAACGSLFAQIVACIHLKAFSFFFQSCEWKFEVSVNFCVNLIHLFVVKKYIFWVLTI